MYIREFNSIKGILLEHFVEFPIVYEEDEVYLN